MELYSGKDPLFHPVEMMLAEENLKEIDFCCQWINNYEKTGGEVEVTTGIHWSQMPKKDIKQLANILMSGFLSGIIKPTGGLH